MRHREAQIAGADEAERVGGGAGQVERVAGGVGPTIDDWGDGVMPVIGECDLGAAGKALVGDAERGPGERLAAGGPPAVEAGPVPGSTGARHRANQRSAGGRADDAVAVQPRIALELLHGAGGGRLEEVGEMNSGGV